MPPLSETPPYIRQEDIDKLAQNYTATVVLPALARDRKVLAPDAAKMGELLDPIELSGQADIYASMFVHAAALLKSGGRLGFVTPNSWLGSEYGRELQGFFLRHFKIIAIVESRIEPWFETAQVNTIFTILECCENNRERSNHLVKFVSVKKKLKDIITWDMQFEASDRWHNLGLIIQKIERAGSEFIDIARDGTIVVSPPNLVNDFEDENFRIRVIKQGELEEDIARAFGAGHWGRFLRAPKIYFDLRQMLADKLVQLSDESIAGVNYGLKPGITDFFTLPSERAKEFGIEKEFLVPFLTTFRDVGKPVIIPKDTDNLLFFCGLDKNELRRQGKKGALKYIEWGETQTTTGRGQVGRAGVPWPEVPSVKNRPRWYDVGERVPGDVVMNQFIGERMFFILNPHKIFVSNTFFEASFVDKELLDVWVALMNSAISYLITEVHGRLTWSVGVMYLYGPEIKTLLLPDARKITPTSQKKILSAFAPLLKRRIKKVSEEVREKDRQEFDASVLEALGLEPRKYLHAIYQGLAESVEARVKLGKMQALEKKTRKTADTSKIKEEIIKEIVPDGLKPFPESFVRGRLKWRDITVPTGKLRLGEYFLGRQKIVNERKEEYEAKTRNEAEFILFAQKPNTHIVRIPESEIGVAQAIQNYRKYLEELREELMRAFVRRTGDEQLSERMVSQTMDELGVLL